MPKKNPAGMKAQSRPVTLTPGAWHTLDVWRRKATREGKWPQILTRDRMIELLVAHPEPYGMMEAAFRGSPAARAAAERKIEETPASKKRQEKRARHLARTLARYQQTERRLLDELKMALTNPQSLEWAVKAGHYITELRKGIEETKWYQARCAARLRAA